MDFRLPDIGEGLVEGEIVKWFIKEGDEIHEDQTLVEVMTDKATVEIPSPTSGIIEKILANEGDTVQVDSIIVKIKENNEENAKDFIIIESEPIEDEDNEILEDDSYDSVRVLATPAIRKFAKENNIDITEIKGSGQNGRISKEDIIEYIREKKNKKEHSEDIDKKKVPVRANILPKELVTTNNITYSKYQPFNKNEERIPLRGIRKKIAEKLQKSKQSIPHFMITDEVDMTNIIELRNEIKELSLKRGIKLTYLPFIIKAVTIALKEFPALNSTLDEEKSELVLKKYYNISFAVATSQGLIVPVLRNADKKSIFSLSREIEHLSEKAREGKIEIEYLKDGTFTVSSIGSVGGIVSAPIINYPESAILAINKIIEKPVAKNGEVIIRSMMNLSMSCDHRIIDGVVSAEFLNRIIELLENPKLLLLEG